MRSPGKRKSSIPKAGPTKTMAPRAKATPSRKSRWMRTNISRITICITATSPPCSTAPKSCGSNPEEAMRGMMVMEAAFASDRTGQAIKVNI